MKPSAPTTPVWILGLILGILGIIGNYSSIPFVSEYDYYLLIAGFALLALGTTFKGV